jgi:flagellar hook-basal body complex protein FliE
MSPLTITAPQLAIPVNAAAPSPAATGEFQNLLTSSTQQVEQNGAQSNQAIQQFLSGENEDLHKVAIASQRADLSSELFLQVRNKVVSAYQEVMRMQM